MRPKHHPSNNDVLLPPAGATPEQVKPLLITRVRYNDGMPGVWSFWQPSDAERQAIAAGASIQISVLGNTHPPLLVGVDGVDVQQPGERT